MSRSTMLTAVLVLMGTAAPAWAQGFGRPQPDQVFQFLDSNQDGRLDSDEINRAGWARGMLERANIDVSRGLSRDDFVREMGNVRQEFDRNGPAFPGRGEGDGDRRRDDGDRRDEERRSDSSRSSSSPSSRSSTSRSKTKEKPRVTIALPEEYRAADLDSDGQIVLFEWRQWKGHTLAEFTSRDRNGDGFLTPRELVAKPVNGSATAVAQAPASDSTPRNGSSNGESRRTSLRSFGPSGAGSQSAPSSAGDGAADSSVLSEEAKRSFGLLDANKNGSIEPEEWAPSRRIRGMFEQAKVDLSEPMTSDEFVRNYVEINAKR
jgi:hypothetical protein